MATEILASVDPDAGRVDARTSRGQAIVMDAAPPLGTDSAPGPKETLLAALAGCTAMDVASILRKKRQRVAAYEVAVSGESATEHPRRFLRITVEHRVAGDVDPEAVRRSVELSAVSYCPVNAMLSASATVEHWYRLESGAEPRPVLVAVTGPEGSRVL